MTPMSREEMREVMLGIADEIVRMCDEHGLTYYITYGTLLGAIRHGDFIPWDDDFDLMMLREDYNTLIEHFDEWRSDDRYKLVSPVKGNSAYAFSKVVDTYTKVVEHHVLPEFSTGVWVDVFPMDAIDPADHKPYYPVKVMAVLRYLAMADPNGGSTPLVRTAERIAGPIMRRLVNPYKMAERMDRYIQNRYPKPTGYVVAAWQYPEHSAEHTFPLSVFEPMKVKFGTREFTAPVGYEAIFENEWEGDWRVPIPRPTHTTEVYWLC